MHVTSPDETANQCEAGTGRTRVRLTWRWWGKDLHAHIAGGKDHIGATALAGRKPEGETYGAVLCVPPHKEDELALEAARRLHAVTGATVCVTAGIHVERITREELERVLQNVDRVVTLLAGSSCYTIARFGQDFADRGDDVADRSTEGEIMKIRQHAMTIAAILAMVVPALAAKVGEAAPALQVAEWAKGEPVVLADGKGKDVFVVVFWVTTSEPCRDVLGLLSELQKKYEDKHVVFIGISSEKPQVVKKFVAENQAKLQFRVAVDDNGACAAAYMRGLSWPHAFVIDQSGNVVWHAHPRSGLAKTIDAVLAGTHDLEAARRLEQAEGLMFQYLQLVRSPSRAKKAAPVGAQVFEYGKSDPILMNELAWAIATQAGLIERDYDLALKAAQAAYEGTEGKNAEILDTYARVLFDSGKKQEAVKYEEQAVQMAPDEEARKGFEQTLEKFRKAAGGG
jgi:peroxiredoxin